MHIGHLGSLISTAIHEVPPNPIDQGNFGHALSTFVHELNATPTDPCFGQVVSQEVLGIIHPVSTDWFVS